MKYIHIYIYDLSLSLSLSLSPSLSVLLFRCRPAYSCTRCQQRAVCVCVCVCVSMYFCIPEPDARTTGCQEPAARQPAKSTVPDDTLPAYPPATVSQTLLTFSDLKFGGSALGQRFDGLYCTAPILLADVLLLLFLGDLAGVGFQRLLRTH
jgi:hypothetical protein